MKVLCIISRDLEKGSTKYRLVQYADILRSRGVMLEFVHRDELRGPRLQTLGDFDAVLNQKCLIPLSLSKKILQLSRRTIFDFDDAIYTRPGRPYSLLAGFRARKRFRFWLEEADIVTTANHYLAEQAEPYAAALEIIPMSVDTDIWRPAEKKTGNKITVGWAGSPATVYNLEQLGPVLAKLLQKNHGMKLAVFSGKKPELPCPYEFHPYSEGTEPAFIQGLDIGLLPLADEEFSRGKSPIKAIQYLACGVPVVGNIIGASSEILRQENSINVQSDEDWIKAVTRLAADDDIRKTMAIAGRRFIMENHNSKKTADQLFTLLTGEKTGSAASGQGQKRPVCAAV